MLPPLLLRYPFALPLPLLPPLLTSPRDHPRPPNLQEFHYLWTAPLEAAAILGLLGYLTNNAMLPGLGVILVVLPLQVCAGCALCCLACRRHLQPSRSGLCLPQPRRRLLRLPALCDVATLDTL